jgi:hypothetical protein
MAMAMAMASSHMLHHDRSHRRHRHYAGRHRLGVDLMTDLLTHAERTMQTGITSFIDALSAGEPLRDLPAKGANIPEPRTASHAATEGGQEQPSTGLSAQQSDEGKTE